ncbi:hypothetical protein I3843_03G005100 [Carya illinoinensis]|uniref:Uncharacterized protein n=1 Tax=Carya illinoinensis TaxID=32201 RepID=A0A8T1QXZ7_CARIL|nr:hypothetical protein CIPAW_03G005600 [Carya illinoinensis]KAG6719340.1 hypothetical protein I3842_03G000400 [Carya illinoinensis]KAG7985052.1 hypothetical protein I3843_03G005100 [Carya illinoinensis]
MQYQLSKMKAILFIICLLLASSVLFVPSSVLARELKVEQADASYPKRPVGPRCGSHQRNCTRLIPPPPPPPARYCRSYTRCRRPP